MPLNHKDVTLINFLDKFTWQGDSNKGNRTELELPLFLQIASLLKIAGEIRRG